MQLNATQVPTLRELLASPRALFAVAGWTIEDSL